MRFNKGKSTMGIYVSALNIYPLKSAAAVPVQSAEVTPTGFANDRLAMLVYADGPNAGKVITQRDRGCGKLATLFAYITRGHSIKGDTPYADCFFETPDAEALDARIKMYDEQLIDAKIFGEACTGYNVGDRGDFLSRYMGFPVELVLYASERPRPALLPHARPGDIVSLADGSPFLLTSEPSLRVLREHMPTDKAVGMDRFRPNIVLDGNMAWEEDVMHRVRIGDAELEISKPCQRCVLTTIDQQSGVKTGDNEPLKTLVATRAGNADGLKGVFFGQDALPRKLGTISVGDKVEILSTRKMHPVLAQAALHFGA